MTTALKEAIEQALACRVTNARPLGVGFGLAGARATLSDGRQAAVKAGVPPRPGHLLLEAAMLRDLKRLSNLPVPEVYHAGEELLVMEWIDNDGGAITTETERHAAELLARLHASRFGHFGYDYDTVIGPLPQPNPQAGRWVPFFRDHRLLHMARAAHDEGKLPAKMFARLERLAERLEDLLNEPAHPALIHGDLWTGNVLVRAGRIAGFIDPAIYFAHPEIELAFTTMFGTFGRAFFDAYEQNMPLDEGFHELRAHLYNLYPTLVHVRLFGAGYLTRVEDALRRVGL